MAVLTDVFSRLLSMALMALPVMGVVLLARLALTRAPRKYRYALWLVVGFRLLCPVSFEGLLSIFSLPGLYDLAEATGTVDGGVVTALPPVAAVTVPVSPPPSALEGTAAVSAVTGPSAGEIALAAASVVWALGLLAVLAVGIVGLLRLRRRVAQAVWCGGEVWESDAVSTPFVLGFFRPRIYLPPGLAGTERTCVLAHERHHIRRRDPWWKLLAWCILAVYWWDPAVWLCWVLFCRDMEMSCDEAVLAALGDQVKRGYSLSLVANAAARPIPAALAFGEHDAARRVKNVLKWKKETPRIAFLAFAAVLLVVTVCGNSPASRPEKSWVRLEERESREATFTYQISEAYNAYLLYAEVYDHETLLSRTVLDCWPLREDWPDGQQPAPGPDGTVTEARARRGTATLWAELMWGGDGTGTDMQWWGTVSTAGGGTMGTNLGQGLVPEQAYTAMMWGTLCTETGERVDLGEDTALAVACLSTAPNGAIYAFDVPRGTEGPEAALRNDVTMVLRLRLSTLDAETLRSSFEAEQGSPAQALFDLRSSTLDQASAEAVLEALDTASLGAYTLTVEPEKKALEVAFSREPTDSMGLDAAMLDRGALALALLDGAEEFRWSYPAHAAGDGGESRQTTYLDRRQPDAWARNLGYEDLRQLGQSTAGIRALMDYLNWSTETVVSAAPADASTAARLWDLAQGSGRYDAVREVVYRGPWAVPQLEEGCSVVYTSEEIEFQTISMPTDPAAQDAAMERNALVILYLLPWIEEVRWSYPGPDGAVERRVYGWEPTGEADLAALAASSGYPLARFDQSEEGLAVLLEALAALDTPAAQAQLLYARAQTQTPEELTEELVLRGPWGDTSLAGTFNTVLTDGRLTLQFTREGAWEQAMQQERLGRSGCVLLALYPDLREMRARSVDAGSSTWVTRETAARSLPEGMEIGDYGTSPEMLEALLVLLESLYSGADSPA